MIALKQNDSKVAKYNQFVKEWKVENPEFAEYVNAVDNIDDAFTPYNNWLNSLTNEDKRNLKVIPDQQHDFVGIYVCRDHNDHMDIEFLTDHCVEDNLYDYGVVDNATQIIENCNIPENAVVLMVPILKACEPDCFGWRWHKWGPYYGVQNPKHEYIYDEKDIEMVYCFSVVTLKEENKND